MESWLFLLMLIALGILLVMVIALLIAAVGGKRREQRYSPSTTGTDSERYDRLESILVKLEAMEVRMENLETILDEKKNG